MRGLVLESAGATPVAAEFADPVAAEGQEIVDVIAAGLNPIDLAVPPAAPPAIVGREGVGVTADGRRVYFSGVAAPWGAIAEHAPVPSRSAWALSDEVSDRAAIIAGVAGMAAVGALTRATMVRPRESVLVMGATGVVGQVAVIAARVLGAGRVVAAGRNADGLDHLKHVGADAVVDLREDPGTLAERITSAADGDVGLVVDMVWGPHAAGALESLGFEGRYVSLGNSAGDATLGGAWRRKLAHVIGFSGGALPADGREALYYETLDIVKDGPEIETREFTLADAQLVWDAQADAGGAKILVRPT